MEQKDKNEIAKLRWIKDHLREIAEDKNDLQENFTPLEVCDMMLDKVNLNAAKSILVLYNIEIIFALRLREYKGEVTFFTSSLKKCEIAPKFLPQVKIEYIEKDKDPLQHLSMAFPDKFDIVIANPPYGSGTKKLDIKFLSKCVDISNGEIIFVHPGSQYVDGKGQNNLYNEINRKISNIIKSVTLFNGNGMFGIGLYVPCSITHLSYHNTRSDFELIDLIRGESHLLEKNKIDEISIFGFSPKFNGLKKRIKEFCDSNGSLKELGTVLGFSGDQSSKMVLKNPDSFFVETTHIGGSSKKGNDVKNNDPLHENNFFVFLKKNNLNFKKDMNPSFRIWFEFITPEEARNFICYCKTDFFRFCLSFTKTNQNVAQNELSYIPWMDFTQEWTDERLYKHFNITEEEQAFIKEIIPPYYDTGGTETED